MSLSGNTAKINELLSKINALPESEEPSYQAKTVSPSTSAQTVEPDSGYDALSQVTVNAMPTATQATPSISVSSGGLITASATQTAGYVASGTKSATKQLTVQAAKTVTPSTSSQTAVASGRYTTGAVTVAAIPSAYVKPTATKSATTYTPTTTNQTIAAGTYCSGAQTIKGDSNLVAGNIKSGVSIFGVAGSYEGSGGGSGGGGSGTCTVNVSGTPANWIYTTVDNAGNFSGKRTEVNTGTLSVACNTMITVGYTVSTFNAGYFTCTNAEMVYKHNFYYASFLITAPAGGIATISFTKTSICCFAAGTPVLTSLQGDTAAIETFNVGDDIVSYDIKTGKNYVAKVNRVVVHENTTDMAEVLFENGAMLTMNAYHPIFTNNGFHSLTRYDGYDELVVGDMAKTADGWTRVVEIKRYQSEPIVTYNLGVANIGETNDDDTNDTYYANGIVVHNVQSCS